jgi:hypothetical protein
MLSLILSSVVPSKHAEHTHQELMRYGSGTDAFAEHTHQELMRTLFLTRMLSISVLTINATVL